MNVDAEVLKVVQSVLGLGSGAPQLGADSALLGSVAELDSMAVVSILTALEEKFGISVDDDEVDGGTFATVSSLTQFVRSKLDA
jgi:acyl carrier protein